MRLPAIASAANGTYTATRYGADTTDGFGRRVAGSTSTFTFVASIQPVGGLKLSADPEARSGTETRVVYTTTALRGGSRPDTVAIDGETWVVTAAESWNAYGSVHCRAMISRQARP